MRAVNVIMWWWPIIHAGMTAIPTCNHNCIAPGGCDSTNHTQVFTQGAIECMISSVLTEHWISGVVGVRRLIVHTQSKCSKSALEYPVNCTVDHTKSTPCHNCVRSASILKTGMYDFKHALRSRTLASVWFYISNITILPSSPQQNRNSGVTIWVL